MNAPPAQPGLCSIIMPCYNRASFLAEAIGAIQAQSSPNWELIVVDDGSTDDTKPRLERLTQGLDQSVRYLHQPNGGAYAARNRGLDLARGEFIAFYDSDDLWLPHHLAHAADALNAHQELDWVYADCKKIEQATGRVLAERGFHEGGKPHPMLSLRTHRFGLLHLYDDPRTVAVELRHNLCCLLQTSVIRAGLFAGRRFEDHYRNEGEDELFPIRAMKAGFRLGYLDDIHLIYRAHGGNASASAVGISPQKRLRITAAAARGYEELAAQVELTPAESRALRRRLANEYFWKRGYAVFWRNGRVDEAIAEFRRGLAKDPWCLGMWKTYLLCRLRAMGKRN